MELFDMSVVYALVPVVASITELIGKKIIKTKDNMTLVVSFVSGVLSGTAGFFMYNEMSLLVWIASGLAASMLASGLWAGAKNFINIPEIVEIKESLAELKDAVKKDGDNK